MMTEEFLKKVKEAKENGKTVGLVQGSWDMFHIGHLKYIKEARKLCDFLVVATDSDEKIKKRKGPSRPIIPENERTEFIRLLDIADEVIVKDLNEPKWNLIKTIEPDVLVVIKENYTETQIEELKKYCKNISILPRQYEGSTSNTIRRAELASRLERSRLVNEEVLKAIEETKKRINYSDNIRLEIKLLFENMKYSTDPICPVCVGCFWNNEWYFGTNQVDFSLPKYDIENRTELFYDTTEHAEINLLKRLGNVPLLNVPIWTSLFPCDKCMKVLIDKGVKEIYYLEDHPERNWSKRSHALAEKKGIKVINLLEKEKELSTSSNIDMKSFNYIYPPNARKQTQLDIMMDFENKGIDPMDPKYIEQEILFSTNHWFISNNRFPYEGVDKQFLIVSTNPIYKIEDISIEMWEELQSIWLILQEKYNLPGGALCFRFGDPAYSGASLTRLHCHLIIPKEEEKTRFPIGGHKTLKKGLYIQINEK